MKHTKKQLAVGTTGTTGTLQWVIKRGHFSEIVDRKAGVTKTLVFLRQNQKTRGPLAKKLAWFCGFVEVKVPAGFLELVFLNINNREWVPKNSFAFLPRRNHKIGRVFCMSQKTRRSNGGHLRFFLCFLCWPREQSKRKKPCFLNEFTLFFSLLFASFSPFSCQRS